MHTLTSTADTVTAIPGMLGYIPAESVVAVLLRHGYLHVIGNAGAAQMTSAGLDQFVSLALAEETDTAFVVAVAGTHATTAIDYAHAVTAKMAAAGLEIAATVHTPALTEGTRWTDLGTGRTGDIGDPYSHPTALARLHSLGFPIAPNREAVENLFTAVDPVAELAAAEQATISDRDHGAKVLRELADTITGYTHPTPDLTARTIAFALADRRCRDALLGLTTVGTGAGRVLTEIANRARGAARIELLTVAAVVLYAIGNTPAANIAINRAHDEAAATGTEIPTLLELMTTALMTSLPPSGLQRTVRFGAEVAHTEYGIAFDA
ncbi:DUF4192 domain-containing protein [Nocardia sp. alder85J]|uniref:DUF4192 domain-containing protein n=1 Tax=Nocardia sp. alder85J TaxID=2862949 RepID=UPI001CD3C077|nr:DUF4192 domain-containing protein [Nocardia sp. alder85J]MCX4099114.1 DUF4192 domain-containing protein [Nocardia sp. alder85J]